MKLATTLLGQRYSFDDVKEVLAKASERKSGDELAGVAAHDPKERVAAKIVLAGLTLAELRQHPVVPYEIDEVTRNVEDNLDGAIFSSVSSWTVS